VQLQKQYGKKEPANTAKERSFAIAATAGHGCKNHLPEVGKVTGRPLRCHPDKSGRQQKLPAGTRL